MAENEVKTSPVYARIPIELHKRLFAAAAKGRRSVSAQVELLIERGLRKAKP